MVPVQGQLRTWNFMYLRDSTARAATTEFQFRDWTRTLAQTRRLELAACRLPTSRSSAWIEPYAGPTCEEYGEGEQDAHDRPHEVVSVAEGLLQVVCHRDGRLALPLQLDLQPRRQDAFSIETPGQPVENGALCCALVHHTQSRFRKTKCDQTSDRCP